MTDRPLSERAAEVISWQESGWLGRLGGDIPRVVLAAVVDGRSLAEWLDESERLRERNLDYARQLAALRTENAALVAIADAAAAAYHSYEWTDAHPFLLALGDTLTRTEARPSRDSTADLDAIEDAFQGVARVRLLVDAVRAALAFVEDDGRGHYLAPLVSTLEPFRRSEGGA